MGDFKAFWTGTGLSALMMVMGGCDSSERVQDPAGSKPTIGARDVSDSSEFDRDLIAAKSGNADPARREQAMLAVFDKYGVVYPKANAPVPAPAGELADGAAPIGAAAAKTAFIAASWNPVRRDFQATNDIHTFSMSVFVDNGQSLAIAAIGSTANVDPFLVATYKDEALSSDLDAYPVRVVGFNDDVNSSNRNSVVGWTNNTGRWRVIDIVAFAYSSATRGQARLVVNTSTSSQILTDREIGGLHQYGATSLPIEPTNCFPRATQVWLQGLSGTPSLGAALVIDTKTMRGGFVSLSATTKLPLDLPWIVDNPYPSFALVYNPEFGVLPSNWSQNETPTTWRFLQRDNYSCVN